jgi:transcriptional regulator with XRE-family HTH domain
MENDRAAADGGRPDPEVQAGWALRRLRLSRNWSQEEVARRMKACGYDFHQTTIAKIEAAQRPLRVRELADFAALYGVGVQELVYPPNHRSLAETDQEIAEVTARRDIVRDQAAKARCQLDAARQAMYHAEETYHASVTEATILEGHLAVLLEARRKLVGWASEEGRSSEVSAEDLRKHGDKALRLAHDLAPGESARWADLVNTAASIAEIEDLG